jgi:hypothetical protein
MAVLLSKVSKLLTDRGSTLLIVLVLTSVVMLVGTTVLQMNLNSKVAGETARQDSDLILLQAELQSLFEDETSCRAALGGPATYHPAGVGGTWVWNPNLGDSGNLTIYHKDGVKPFIQPWTSGAVQPVNRFGHLVITGITLKHIAVPGQSNGDSLLVTSPTGAVTNYYHTYWSLMTITAMKSSGTQGSNIMTHIKMSVQVYTDYSFISCTSLNFTGSDVFPLPVCDPGSTVFSTGQYVRCVVSACTAPSNPVAYPSYYPSGDLKCN